MAKWMREAKFRSASSRLRVYAHEGKTGYLVGVSLRNPGAKAITGCQDKFETLTEADEKFNARVAEAQANGWVPREVGTFGARKAKFDAIPAASAPAPAPETPAPTEEVRTDRDAELAGVGPKLVANGGKKGKK